MPGHRYSPAPHRWPRRRLAAVIGLQLGVLLGTALVASLALGSDPEAKVSIGGSVAGLPWTIPAAYGAFAQ